MIGNTHTPPKRFFAATFLAMVAAACSGGGGGGVPSDAAPVIVAASFQGGSSTPAAGDTLTLVFSETVTLGAGLLLDDTDVTLSAGATLGTVTAAPTVLSTTTVQITLGNGVAFTPGTTTIGFSTENDVVRDVSSQLGTGGTPVTIGTSDGVQPTIGNFTIASVDAALNGTGAAGGTLQVPSNGWTIDLSYSDNSAISTAQTQITCSTAVSTPAGVRQPGANLLDQLTTVSANNTSASYSIPSNVTFTSGAITLTAVIVDASGLASTPATFAATVRAFTDQLRPFETNVNPSQVWFLDFDRDLESFATSAGSIAVSVDTVNGANGRGDFEDLLRILGLANSTPIAMAGGDSNTVAFDRIKNAIVTELTALYSGANVQFVLTQPSGTLSSTSVPYASVGYSQISIAGASTTPGVLGLAIFDPNNTTQNDNTNTNFQSQRLGVFVHTVVASGMDSPGSAPFRITFDPLAPSQGGTALGDDASDDDRLTGATVDARKTQIDTAIADLARFVAVVVAHECGHSVGLVQDGAMPIGLYGGDTSNFPGSSSGHIRTTAQFPVGSTNVMSPSLSYSGAVNAASAFNTLNLAYLREQVFYGN